MKTTVSTVQKMKDNGEKITMLTAYDYSTAKLFDEAGIDTMLVGDSLGMVMLGYDSTSGLYAQRLRLELLCHNVICFKSFLSIIA